MGRFGAKSGIKRRSRRGSRKPVDGSADVLGPSPNPETNLAIADIALRGVTMMARRGVERVLLGRRYSPKKARAILKGRGFTQTLLHRQIAKVATRSVPGAILVGGGMLAKTLYDRSRSHESVGRGEAALQDQAEDGADGHEIAHVKAQAPRR
jgi:hypothetical protein